MESAASAASPSSSSASADTAADSAAFTLFYGKFRSQAPRVTRVVSAVEARVDNLGERNGEKDPDPTASSSDPLWREYDSVLSDCHSVYFACRAHLLTPSVRAAIDGMVAKYK